MIRQILQNASTIHVALLEGSHSLPLRLGYAAVGAMALILCLWSIAMPLAESIVASGTISVSAQRREIAHLHGGKIAELYIKEGDPVAAGQALIRLDDREAQSEIEVLLYQRYARQARIDRLSAERNRTATVHFRDDLVRNVKTDLQIAQLLSGEERNFLSRNAAMMARLTLLDEQRDKASDQKKRLLLQKSSVDRQLEIVREQAVNAQDLYEKGYGTRSQAIALRREVEKLITQRLQIEAEINTLDGVIQDTKLNKNIYLTEEANNIEGDILAAQNEIAELDEKIKTAKTHLDGLVIRSSVDGVVVELRVTSVGDVIKPAAPLLDVLPLDSGYLVEAHIAPTDIEGIVKGLPVEVRFPSLVGMGTPSVSGEVLRVSADVLASDDKKHHYYQLLVSIDDQKKVSQRFEIIPGMPTEIIVRKKDRSLLEYIFAPVTDHLSRAVVG